VCHYRHSSARAVELTGPAAYWNKGHIKSISIVVGSTTDVATSYNYDSGGTADTPLLQSQTDTPTSNTMSYTYTNREFLASATPTTGTSYTYTYGTNGNLTRMVSGTTTKQLSQMATGQLCWTLSAASSNSCTSPPSGSTLYSYNADGNEQATTPPTGTGEKIAYNPIGQTTSLTPAGGTTEAFAYTGADSTQRVNAGTAALTNNAYGVATSTTSGTTTAFTYNPGSSPNLLASTVVGSTRYYYLYDGLGNVVALINSSGTEVGSYTYTPYGRTTVSNTGSNTEATANPFRFQSGYQDPTGFYKFGTRYYSPGNAIWTQPDPESGSLRNPTTLLRYPFDNNDPLNVHDPKGLNGACGDGDSGYYDSDDNVSYDCYPSPDGTSGDYLGVFGRACLGGIVVGAKIGGEADADPLIGASNVVLSCTLGSIVSPLLGLGL
jgi:RHS repeat-associated protein